MGGVGGQASLDGSIIGPSPFFGWDSKGVTLGVAGQGTLGGFIGGGAAAGLGSYEADANIDMWGTSYSQSYRGIDWFCGGKTEIMGTDVGAFSSVESNGYSDDHIIGTAFVEGGYIAGGIAASKTIQMTQGGLATASAVGTYSGSGNLGSDFNGSAVGYTQTRATTYNGYNGSIMTSSAGMSVSSTSNSNMPN
jgi:hypothetical protein